MIEQVKPCIKKLFVKCFVHLLKDRLQVDIYGIYTPPRFVCCHGNDVHTQIYIQRQDSLNHNSLYVFSIDPLDSLVATLPPLVVIVT